MSDVQTDQSDADLSPVSPPADPAAAAFEMLREEVALARRAVAGLSAERAGIEIPDYSETLANILQACMTTAERLKELSQTPALRKTAQSWGREIEAAAETARRADQHALSQAITALQDATDNLSSWISSAHDADRQNTWLKVTGSVSLAAGMVLGVIAGWLAFAAAPPHRTREQQAAVILGMTEEKAGEHLIQSASPKLWNDLVLGDRIVIANRKALDRCEHRARKRSEQCVIELPADLRPWHGESSWKSAG